ncbi:MAG: FmdB family zinc ribbon protein [Jiangellaceae bacterium]
MPTYQYACTDCGDQLEVVQKFTDDALTTCPTCDGRLRKVYSAIGVVFKGSGFYRTDSRAAVASNGSGNGDGSSKADSSSEREGSSSTSGSDASTKGSGNGSSRTKEPAAKKEPAGTSAS